MKRISRKYAVFAFVVYLLALTNLPAIAGGPCEANGDAMRSLAASLQARYSSLVPGGQLAFNVLSRPNSPVKTVVVRHLIAGKTVFSVETSTISASA